MTLHRIASVHWPKGVKPADYDGCPMTCICGWSGTVSEWETHRGDRTDTDRKRAHRATGHTRWELDRNPVP